MRRCKLVLNLCRIDELCGLAEDPGVIDNPVDDPSLANVRNPLHNRLPDWMNDRMDPLRGPPWYGRPWRPGLRLDPFGTGRKQNHAGTH
jgi:hypothetical protein